MSPFSGWLWSSYSVSASSCSSISTTARSQRYRARGGMPRRGLMGKRGAAAADVQGDTLEDSGGDALRIDRDALRELMGTLIRRGSTCGW